MKYIFLIPIFLISFKSNSFNYITDVHAKRKVMATYTLTKNQKIIYFSLIGTFKENHGN